MTRQVKPDRLDEDRLLVGVAALARAEPAFSRIVQAYGPPPLWARDPGFHTLLRIILEQQVSLASARAAYDRLAATVRPLTPATFLGLPEASLRAVGFSRQKAGYGRALAQAILDGTLDLDDLDGMDDAGAAERLVQVKGIGPWTADIYLLMALGRPDVWPRGDLALAVALQRLNGWSGRPDPKTMNRLGEPWRPWRSVAARLLWHFYLNQGR